MTAERAHHTWPPERFFWSVLDAPGYTGGTLPAGLLGALEADLPLPLDQLHAVAAPAGEGCVVVCAARVRDLEPLDPAMLSLTPERVPEPAGVEGMRLDCDPSDLNLLVGRFEPAAIRGARLRGHWLMAAAVLACAALVSAGLLRRELHQDRRAAAARAAAITLATSVSSGPDQLALEVARARQGAAAGPHPTPDAAAALAKILAAWPAVPARTQSISVGPQVAALEVAVEGEATEFVQSLHPPEGWTLDEPRLVRMDALTRLSLRLRRSEPTP